MISEDAVFNIDSSTGELRSETCTARLRWNGIKLEQAWEILCIKPGHIEASTIIEWREVPTVKESDDGRDT